MTKILLPLLGIGALVVIAVVLFGGDNQADMQSMSATTEEAPVALMEEIVDDTMPTEAMSPESFMVVPPGTYEVVAAESVVNWAGQKPLIDGYINRGAIAVSGGTVTVGEATAMGAFTIDMTTLSVSATPAKPGQESALEGHLKGSRWFDTEAYPTASFTITEVVARPDSETTFTYDVTGSLEMRGVTNEVRFPATIYLDDRGRLVATADFEIDRTRWGIQAGSASFFDNLADNAVADEVAISFRLVAVEN